MIFKIYIYILGVHLRMTQASPFPTSGNAHYVRQHIPTAAPLAVVNPDNLDQGEYVVTLVNSHTTAITTEHGQNENSPTAFHDGGSIVGANSTAIFAVPTNWAGRVAVAEAEIPIRDRASLLEGSFLVQGGGDAQIALDVSYVDGFTVPIVCTCENRTSLGCNLNLLETCPGEYRVDAGTCMNPLRDGGDPTNNIFKACAALAYTFPTDDKATTMGIEGCEKSILCCVGTACAPNPRQELCAAADGTAQPCSWARR
ncbi:hypothetical protein F4859DRAFT_523835 [Xylaria cf. heliscus]|nr:hypothetical protein F4859DRAFT_523835 [Xylaria cf. heliscus]